MKKILGWGLFAFLLGTITTLLSVYVKEVYKPSLEYEIVIINFFNNIGLALISVGVIGIILNFNDWKKYFQERLAETMREREYLYSLNDEQLISLQTDALKAFFKVKDIDREGSFLNYFHSKIHNLIASPYREATTAIITVEKSEDENIYIVNEEISFICRKVGNYIQEEVRWLYYPEELVDLIGFKIKVEQNRFAEIFVPSIKALFLKHPSRHSF